MRPKTVVEIEAERYAREHFVNEQKREAFVAGSVFLARKIVSLADHGALVDGSADKSTKKMLDDLTLSDILKIVYGLLEKADVLARGEK